MEFYLSPFCCGNLTFSLLCCSAVLNALWLLYVRFQTEYVGGRECMGFPIYNRQNSLDYWNHPLSVI